MAINKKSPKIVRLEWGEVELDDGSVYKDVKLFPGGARAWNWGETGTHHNPGVQMSDVDELLKNGAEVVVLTRGVLGRLGVPHDVVNMLKDRGIEVYVKNTKQAVDLYNQLRDEKKTGILIHSTC